MKKALRTATLAMAALSVLLVAGCGGNGNHVTADDPTAWESLQNNDFVTIEFHGRDVDTEKANYEQFVNEFNNTHDNILVSLQWTSDTAAYNTALDGMGDDLPDVFMLSQGMFMRYAASGKIADIGGHVSEGVLEDLYSSAYDIYYFDRTTRKIGYSENASLYGLPKDMGPQQMAVNTTLLRETVNAYNAQHADAPLSYDDIVDPTSPMTFDEFLDVGKKLKSALVEGSNKVVICDVNQQSTVYSNNASYFTVDANGKWTSNITSDNFVEAIEFIQELYKEGLTPSAGSTTNAEQKFTSGQSIFFGDVAPHMTKDWWNTVSFEWDLLPVLQGRAEGAVSTAYVGGMCYAIAANCPYKDAALEFVEYLTSDPTSQRSQYGRGQCIPNLKSLADEFSTDGLGLIAEQSKKTSPCPANRGVWIDAVNGTSATDVVSGKYGAESYTLEDMWLTQFKNWLSTGETGDIYQKKGDGSWVDVRTSLTAFQPTMQAYFDDQYSNLVYVCP